VPWRRPRPRTAWTERQLELDVLSPIEDPGVHQRVSKTLKQLRTERNLSQRALATKAKISRGYLARLEAAEQDPTLGVLERLAKALGVPVTELLT
jgi:ribosome-binding protein aMBF1 (putative translation factor)